MSELVEAVQLEADEKMAKAVEHAQSEFASIRTGRASPAATSSPAFPAPLVARWR